MSGAPYPFVNPNCLSLTAETGTHFDDPTTNVNSYTPNALSRNSPFTPYLPQQQHQPRSTYGPLRHQHRNPTVAPFRPASPHHSTLNPTARSFTPPQQAPSRIAIETRQEQDAGVGATATSPTTSVTPRIEVSPADDAVADVGLTAVQAVRQLTRTKRDSSPGSQPVGIHRRPRNAGRSRSVRTAMPLLAPDSTQRPIQQFPAHQQVNNNQSVSDWLDSSYALSLNGQPPAPPVGAQGPSVTSHPQRYPRPSVVRSTTGTSASTAVTRATAASRSGPYFCADPSCSTPGKPWPTRSALEKHARIHLPESARPYGCHAKNCFERFWWPKDQRRHERRMHSGESVLCGVCGHQLSREDNLARHIATVHRELDVPATPSQTSISSPAMSARTVTTQFDSFAAQTPRSEIEYSLTVPSSPPSIGTPYHPYASGSRAKRPRHLSFASGQGPPPSFRMPMGPPGSHAMEKSQSSGW